MKKIILLIAAVLMPLMAFAGLKNSSTGKTDAYTDVTCSGGVGCSVSKGVMAISSDSTAAAQFSSLTVDSIVIDNNYISGRKSLYESTTTSDTILAAETGTNYGVNTTGSVFTLPTAAVGLEYTFLGGAGITFSVKPSSTADKIQYLGLASGEKITSPAQTSDSVTLISVTANKWRVKNMTGTFTNGG